jgi:hypothetical protein
MTNSIGIIIWLEHLFAERFGCRLILSIISDSIVMRIDNSQKLIVFDKPFLLAYQNDSTFPCFRWNCTDEGFIGAIDNYLPAPSVEPLRTPLIQFNLSGASIRYDVLGLIYWMLSRQEEVGSLFLDDHDRFPAYASHAFKHKYLDRPIVDEWIYILAQIIKRVWPQIGIKSNQFEVVLSHDVDLPSRYCFRSYKSCFKAILGDIVKYKNYKAALLAPYILANTQNKLLRIDPFNTFQWIMEKSEQNNLASTFFFICGKKRTKFDAGFPPGHPVIRNLMREINQRGHSIGVHPTYLCYNNADYLAEEVNELKKIFLEEKINQGLLGSRMHFLRWRQPETLRILNDIGLDYDFSLGYADSPGYRCGTSFEYNAIDPIEKKALKIRLKPLIVMETSIFNKKYQGLDYNSLALRKLINIKSNCKKVGGRFAMLWHNSELFTDQQKQFYSSVIGD